MARGFSEDRDRVHAGDHLHVHADPKAFLKHHTSGFDRLIEKNKTREISEGPLRWKIGACSRRRK